MRSEKCISEECIHLIDKVSDLHQFKQNIQLNVLVLGDEQRCSNTTHISALHDLMLLTFSFRGGAE